MDHYVPRARGGSDDPSNLVLVCTPCNRRKGATVPYATDFNTGRSEPLFDPRHDDWDAHFLIRDGHTVGRTATGRASAAVLFRSTKQTLNETREWEPLDWFDDAYLRSAACHLLRMHDAGRFRELEKAVDALARDSAPLSDRDRAAIKFVLTFMSNAVRMKRGRATDLDRNMQFASEYARRPSETGTVTESVYRRELLAITNIQLELVYFQRGRHRKAREALRTAAETYATLAEDFPDRNPAFGLRSIACLMLLEPDLKLKLPVSPSEDVLESAQRGDYLPLGDLVDARVRARSPGDLSVLADLVGTVMETAGYRQTGDLAQAIALRRRQWNLLIALGEPVDEALLAADLEHWQASQMRNELRRFRADVTALTDRDGARKRAEEALSVVRLQAPRTGVD